MRRCHDGRFRQNHFNETLRIAPMIKLLGRKWRWRRQKDQIDILLMYIVAAGKIGCKITVEDNHGVVQRRAVVGYNKTKVFLDIDHRLAWLPKDHIKLSDTELKALLEFHEETLVPPLRDKVGKHLKKFKGMEGQPVRFRHTITGQIYRSLKFNMNHGDLMDIDDPATHVPVQIEPGLFNKIYYLEELEILEKVT